MPKHNRQTICMVAVVVLLIAIAAIMRILGRIGNLSEVVGIITGGLRALIYIGLFSVWGFSLRRRIIQSQTRRNITAISALMVFWMVVRTLKYNFFADTHIGRYLWYLYYLSMLFIPLLVLFIALSLGKSEKFRLPKWTKIFFIVSSLFTALVLTNDFHQLVFGFPNGLLFYNNSEYTHRVLYYVIMIWMSLCAVAAFVVIALKCRVPSGKRLIYLPFIPLCLLILYMILYLTAFDFIRFFAGDMTVVFCLFTAVALEACIQCGLIQSNTHYTLLFECTSIHSMIADSDYNILLSSADTEPIPKEIMRQTEFAPVMLDGGTRLCGTPLKSGYVIWSEDVSEISDVISELADSSEYLTARKSILQKEVETRREEQRLAEQNRLYNSLMSQNKEALLLYSELIRQLEAANHLEQEKKLTAKLAIVCTHIKRRGNLLFLSETGDSIYASEVRFALEEWVSNLRLCGVKCNIYFNMESQLSFAEIVFLYDTFQHILLYILDTLHSMLISADEKDGNPVLMLNLSCDRNLSDVSIPRASVYDEGDGEWIIRISVPKGGAAI